MILFRMTREEFTKFLKSAGLNKKRFAELSGENYHTVLGWGRFYQHKGDEHKKNVSIPIWTQSWINNYKKVKEYEKLIEIINKNHLEPSFI